MEALLLLYRDEPLRDFPLTEQPLEIGSGAGADLVVHDPEVADRHFLVRRVGLDVLLHDLRHGEDHRPERLLPGIARALGKHHALLRVSDVPTRRGVAANAARTEPVVLFAEPDAALSLVFGTLADARRVPIGNRPLVLGSSAPADVVVTDRAVSHRHCRIEPSEGGPLVRDLGSRNGTFVDGVRTGLAVLRAGARIRVGRTELRVVPRGQAVEERTGFVAASRPMRELLDRVERVAPLPWPVLVLGESGVGKEGIASALHHKSPRRAAPFVAVNAGAMTRDLVESELFGHERGAFTGASQPHRGVFEQASGGTLFLDEIGELPLDLQPRLLRVLETGDVRRVGGESSIRTDARVVCATHRDLRERVARGEFREDLYYRIAQIVLSVPPLRQRPVDVRALAEHFLVAAERDVGPRRVSEAALVRLEAYGWPGNVRQLRNVVWSAAALAAGGVIDVPEIDEAIASGSAGAAPSVAVVEVLDRHGGNLSAAARSLGVARSTLRNRLRHEASRSRRT